MDTHVAKDGVLVHGPNYRISCSTTSSRGCSSSSSSGSQCCGGAPEYLFHLASTATWPVAPRVVFGIMTQCDGEALLRDMARVVDVRCVEVALGVEERESILTTRVKVLWRKVEVKTRVWKRLDLRDPHCLKAEYHMLDSEYFARFSGRWAVEAVLNPGSGVVVGCRMVQEQEVMPRGLPPFLLRLPGLGAALRATALRVARRMADDLNAAVDKFMRGQVHDGGVSQAACAPGSQQQHQRAALGGCGGANGGAAVVSLAADATVPAGAGPGGPHQHCC